MDRLVGYGGKSKGTQPRSAEYHLWSHNTGPLKQIFYSSRRPHQVPLRLQFTQTHLNWTTGDWKNAVWSEESGFQLQQSGGQNMEEPSWNHGSILSWINGSGCCWSNGVGQWFSNLSHRVPPNKRLSSPSTTPLINIKVQWCQPFLLPNSSLWRHICSLNKDYLIWIVVSNIIQRGINFNFPELLSDATRSAFLSVLHRNCGDAD